MKSTRPTFVSGAVPAVLIAALRLCAQNQPAPVTVNADPAIVQDFEKRVSDYQKLHKSVEGALPKLKRTQSVEKIERHQHELARRIREARPGAKQGDILTAEISAEFRRLIALAMQGQRATNVKQSLKHAEPVHLPRLRVNHTYPEHLPLQSTPPTLLQNLPKLPPEIDYRVVGRDLILLDTKANFIVDLIPNAIPDV